MGVEHRKKTGSFVKDVKAIEDDHNHILKDHNLIKTQMDKAALDFKQCETEDVKLTEDIACNEQRLVNLQQKDVQEKELSNLENLKASQNQKIETILESLKGKAEELRIPKEKKEAAIVPLQRQLTEVKKVVEVAQTELTLLQEKTEKTKNEIEGLK